MKRNTSIRDKIARVFWYSAVMKH